MVNAKPSPTGQSPWVTILGGVLPTMLLVGFWVWIIQRYAAMGEGGGLAVCSAWAGRRRASTRPAPSGRRSRTSRASTRPRTSWRRWSTFSSIPTATRLGAQIPRGVLLSGQPGTGKTLLARAVAGEANVPFYSISASEFVEMVVGVGASRVRDLFEQAKADAPSIIFIDELDAIGRSRSSGAMSGSNDEREQTLNQILTEMDGFTGNEGVIVLAATNRPEILDSALLRAGRFDRRITVNPPDQEGRLKILQVHTRSVPLEDPSVLEAIAASTPGMVGADLKNLVNEAALTAARRGETAVSREDFTNALERITLGAARRIVISDEERRRTAYHESGHALLGMLQPGADPVRKISIIPRGQALGVTFQSPSRTATATARAICTDGSSGCSAAAPPSILIYGETTTGPESDLEQATALARQMVGRWGMSEEVGAISALPRSARRATPAARLAAHARADRRRGQTDPHRMRRGGRAHAGRAPRAARPPRPNAAPSETLDEADAYAVAGIPRQQTADPPVTATA